MFYPELGSVIINRTMIKYLVFFVVAITFFVSLPNPVHAAKKRVFTPKKAVSVTYSSAKLSRSTNSIIATFKNLSKVKRIEYALSYSANGISQGVMGSFVPSGQPSENRDLYFGTCSKGVCTPHYGITNATLTVTTTLTSGATHTKRYVIKRF
jgi:hypothetical protein